MVMKVENQKGTWKRENWEVEVVRVRENSFDFF